MSSPGSYSHSFYCDESGNTGANYADPDQPVMVMAGWLVAAGAEDSIRKAIAECATGPSVELHAKRLLRRPDGWKRVANICAVPPEHGALPFFYIVEKRYQLVERIVHSLLDRHTNPRAYSLPSLGHPAYDPLVDRLYDIVPDSALTVFATAIASPSQESLSAGVQALSAALRPSNASLAHVVLGCLDNLDAVLASDFRGRIGHSHHQVTSPHLPGFMHLLSAVDAYAVDQRIDSVQVVHDESRQYAGVWRTWFENLCERGRRPDPGPTNPLLRPAFWRLRSISPGSSESCRCLQAADALATALSRLVRACCLGEAWSREMQSIARTVFQGLLSDDTSQGGISASQGIRRVLGRNLLTSVKRGSQD